MQSCAVIGCGAAGMVATTTLRQSGLLVTCFELAADPGGVWNSDTRSPFSSRGLISPIHPTLRCILPKDILSFSDIRFDYTVPQFPHHSSVRRYLEQYAEKKGVRGLVRFNTKVQSVRFDTTAAVWRIITVNIVNGDVFEWAFDKVCVCTGQTHEPRYPAGVKEILTPYIQEGGELHHASHVKDFRQFKNKRIVVVGDGVTAWDYCLELRRFGANVIHSRYTPLDLSLNKDKNNYINNNSSDGYISKLLWKNKKKEEKIQCIESHRGAMRDVVSASLEILSRTPGWRHDAAKGSRIISNYMRVKSNVLLGEKITLGRLLACEGRGIRFEDLQPRAGDILTEAKTRFLAGEGGRQGRNNKNNMQDNEGENGTFIDNVDAVIFATGFNSRYPFLHHNIRNILETPLLMLSYQDEKKEDLSNEKEQNYYNNRGLYLGTLYSHNPSIAFIGMQKELLPPFLLFEAQAKFIGYAFTNRLKLPINAESLMTRELELIKRYPLLVNLCSPHGLGLYSAIYYNVLQEELQVGSRNTYTASMIERQKWILLTSLLRIVHKARSLAPLKRKQQHILFSNAI